MKRVLITLLSAGVSCFAAASVVADQHEDDGFLVIPVELWACSLNDGKDSADVDAFAKNFNKWADDHGIDDYAAWTLSPWYFGPGANAGFDVLWLGAAKDAVALGSLQEKWLAPDNSLLPEATELWRCDAHTSMASVNYKPTPKGKTPENSVMTFSDCNYNEDASFEAIDEAMGAWSAYIGEKGSEAGIFHWYPVYGGGGEDYGFKWIEAHSNLETLGADFEMIGNGRGYEKYGELFGPLIECDSSRVYRAKNHRFVQLR